VQGVRGYADTRLRIADRPLDSRNRRVSIIVENLDADKVAALINTSSQTSGSSAGAPAADRAPSETRPAGH
jgi:hypothetical protein